MRSEIVAASDLRSVRPPILSTAASHRGAERQQPLPPSVPCERSNDLLPLAVPHAGQSVVVGLAGVPPAKMWRTAAETTASTVSVRAN
jgi:hypothetical protein